MIVIKNHFAVGDKHHEMASQVILHCAEVLGLDNFSLLLYNHGSRDKMGEFSWHTRTLKMRISPCLNTYWTIDVICHECVHLKQYLFGELTHDGISHFWKGQKFSDELLESLPDRGCWPWEVDACAIQEKLACSFIDKFDIDIYDGALD